jgi:hypothetical protein
VDPEPWADTTTLDLADVAFLFPLPARFADRDQLLPMERNGQRLILAKSDFASIFRKNPLLPSPSGAATPTAAEADALFASLRVVAVRFDKPLSMRVIVQPVRELPDGSLTTEDATLHVLFGLDNARSKAAVAALHKLKADLGAATTGAALVPHPILSLPNEGPDGPYAKAVTQIVLATASVPAGGVAFMRQGSRPGEKVFGFSKETAFQLRVTEMRDAPEGDEREGTILDPEPGTDLIGDLLQSAKVRTMPVAELSQLVSSSLRLENPDFHTIPSVGCISCHAATRARRFAERVRAADLKDVQLQGEFDAPKDKIPDEALGDDTFILRMFGYFGRDPAATQRVVNEAVDTLHLFNRP